MPGSLRRRLPELLWLERLIEQLGKNAKVKTLTTVSCRGHSLPVYSIRLGNRDQKRPAVAFVGGVHGLERVGSQVVLAFLQTVAHRLRWDKTFKRDLEKMSLTFIPLVNPGGMYLRRRSNPNGVDLMRNAPLDAVGKVTPFVGGQRLTPRLPYYRGQRHQMEDESLAVAKEIRKSLFGHKFALSIDCHSGFGKIHRIWFPYARTSNPPHHLAELYAFHELLNATYPNHIYLVEPQSINYVTHGDLWDMLYDEYYRKTRGVYLPLTLEMGSWLWVRKNPLQLFNVLGLFNPIKPHRERRVMRQNLTLFDFLIRTAISKKKWLPRKDEREAMRTQALQDWYPRVR